MLGKIEFRSMAVPSEPSPDDRSHPPSGPTGGDSPNIPATRFTNQALNFSHAHVEQLYRAMAPRLHKQNPVLEHNFLFRTVQKLVEARAPQSVFDALVTTLAGTDRASVRLVNYLTDGMVAALKNSVTAPVERWGALAHCLVHALQADCQFSWDTLPQLIPKLQKLQLEDFSVADREMLGSCAAFALRRGQSAEQLILAFTNYLEYCQHFTASQKHEAAEKFRIRAESPSHKEHSCFSCFDAAQLMLEDIETSGLSLTHLHRTISAARADATRDKVPDKSPDTTIKVIAIVKELIEHAMAQNQSFTPLVQPVLKLLAHPDTTAESLAVLADIVLPHYRYFNYNLTFLLSDFTPVAASDGQVERQIQTVKQACAQGSPCEPFVSRAYARLARSSSSDAPLALYTGAFLTHPIKQFDLLMYEPTLGMITNRVADAAIFAAQAKLRPEAAIQTMQDYLTISERLYDLGSQPNIDTLQIFQLPNEVLGQFVRFNIRSEALHQLAIQAKTLTGDKAIQNIMARLSELQDTELAWSYLEGLRPEEDALKEAKLREHFRFDQLPFAMPAPDQMHRKEAHDPRALKMFSELREIVQRARTIHAGFTAYQYEARQVPGSNVPSLLAQFARETAQHAWRLQVPAGVFPGPGVRFTGLDARKLFAQDPERPEDPFHLYRAAWSFARKELPKLASADFTFCRGLIAISGPQEDTKVQGHRYTLVVYNDHYKNFRGDGAFLVPTEIFEEALRSINQNQLARGIDCAALTAAELQQAGIRIGKPVLNLLWASNLAGLCNSFPPKFAPHFSWEEKVGSPIFFDKAGHAHKAALLNTSQGRTPPQREAALTPFRGLHDEVYATSRTLLNYYSLFRCGLAAFHKGETVAGFTGESFLFPPDEQNSPQILIQFPRAGTFEGIYLPEEQQMELNADSARMLKECYAWNRACRTGKISEAEAPLLLSCPTLDDWPSPSSFVLDTSTMQLTLHDSTVQLPVNSDGTQTAELEIWKNYVVPLFKPNKDIRLLPRSYLIN